MAENNKVISFARTQKRNKSEYMLKSEISIYIRRTVETYHIDWSSPDGTLSQEDIYSILTAIFQDLIRRVQQIEIKKIDSYEINFTLLYYEKNNRNKEIKYICIPQTIKREKLAEYLYTTISIYELKKAGVL